MEKGLEAYQKAWAEAKRIADTQTILMGFGGAAIAADIIVMVWEAFFNSGPGSTSLNPAVLLAISVSSLFIFAVFMGLFFAISHLLELYKAKLEQKFNEHAGIQEENNAPKAAKIIKHGGTFTEGVLCAAGTYAAIAFLADMITVYDKFGPDEQIDSVIPGQTTIDMFSSSAEGIAVIVVVLIAVAILSYLVGNAVRLGHLYLDGKNSDEEIKNYYERQEQTTKLPTESGIVSFDWAARMKRNVSEKVNELSYGQRFLPV